MIKLANDHRGSRRLVSLSLVLLAMSLAHCAAPRLIARPPATAESMQRAGRLYQGLWARDQDIKTVKATMQIRINKGILTRATQQALLLKRSGSLRIDSFTSFGDLMHQLILHRGLLSILDLQSERARKSHDVNDLLKEELGLDLSVKDIILFLSGGIPLEARSDYLAMKQNKSDVLRGLHSQVLLDHRTGLPIRYMARSIHDSVYEVHFGDYRNISGIPFPFQISVLMRQPHISLKIVYEDVSLNDVLKDEKFEVNSEL